MQQSLRLKIQVIIQSAHGMHQRIGSLRHPESPDERVHGGPSCLAGAQMICRRWHLISKSTTLRAEAFLSHWSYAGPRRRRVAHVMFSLSTHAMHMQNCSFGCELSIAAGPVLREGGGVSPCLILIRSVMNLLLS